MEKLPWYLKKTSKVTTTNDGITFLAEIHPVYMYWIKIKAFFKVITESEVNITWRKQDING